MNRSSHGPMEVFRGLAASLFVMFLALALASFFPRARLWGLNHLAFHPLHARLAALAIVALSFVPIVRRSLYRVLRRWVRSMFGRPIKGRIVTALSAFVVAVILYMVPMDTRLFDEGDFLTALIEEKGVATAADKTVGFSHIAAHERLAPGTLMLYLLASKMSVAVSERGMAGGIAILNILLFLVLFAYLVHVLRRCETRTPVALVAVSLFLFSGTIVLFSGYLSKYTPFFVFSSLYVLSAFLYLNGRGSFAPPIVLFVAACLLHVFGALLVPSFLYLLFAAIGGRSFAAPSQAKEKRMAIVIAILTLAAVIAGRLIPRSSIYYLPLVGSDRTDGILSPGHLLDIVNVLLIALPALPLLVSLPVLVRTLQGRKNLRLEREKHFAFLLLLPWVAALLLLKPMQSLAMNWDRYALSFTALLAVVVIALKRFYESLTHPPASADVDRKEMDSLIHRGFTLVVPPAVILSLVATVSFVWVVSSYDMCGERFETAISFEKASAVGSYAHLAEYYSRRGNMQKAIETSERMVTIAPTPDNRLALAIYYLSAGDTLSAIDRLEESLADNPEAKSNRHMLVTLLDSHGMYNDLIRICREGVEQEPNEPQYYYFIGKSYLYKGMLRQGIEALKKCQDMNPSPQIQQMIDDLVSRIHRKEPVER